jgi:hypothetical protein
VGLEPTTFELKARCTACLCYGSEEPVCHLGSWEDPLEERPASEFEATRARKSTRLACRLSAPQAGYDPALGGV